MTRKKPEPRIPHPRKNEFIHARLNAKAWRGFKFAVRSETETILAGKHLGREVVLIGFAPELQAYFKPAVYDRVAKKMKPFNYPAVAEYLKTLNDVDYAAMLAALILRQGLFAASNACQDTVRSRDEAIIAYNNG